MKRILISIIVAFLLTALALPAYGSIGLGTRAMGMGGAFTAVADDESAFYWNPAGITQIRFISVMLGAGAQGEDFDFIMDTIDKISDQEELKPEDFEPGFGFFNLGLIGGVTTRYVGVNFYSETSGYAENVMGLDLDVGLNNFTYGAATLAGNFGEKIAVGLNVKRVVVGIGFGEVNPGELINQTTYADGDGLAYDLGVLYRLSDQVRFGFIARNLGKDIKLKGERFNYLEDKEYPIEEITIDLPRDIAVGVSYRPFKNTLLAFDVQKCGYRPPYTPEQTRFRIGFEQTALWNIIALRLGAYTVKDEPLALTAGLGFKLGPVNIGVAAVKEEFNGKEATGGIVTTGIRF